VIDAPLTTRILKICTGTSGSLAPFHCHRKKNTKTAKPKTTVVTTWSDAHEYSPPAHVRPSYSKSEVDPEAVIWILTTINVVPVNAAPAPMKSMALTFNLQSPSTFFRGMKKMVQMMVITVSGRFNLKIQRLYKYELILSQEYAL
jgi:hypothetical protein